MGAGAMSRARRPRDASTGPGATAVAAGVAPGHAAPLEAWFAARGWTPAPFQREAWALQAAGRSGLLHAPTGSGKTLAAWGGALLGGLAERAAAGGDEAAGALRPRLRALWITPLKALAADSALALREAAAGVGLDWTIGLRTGDASAREKRLAKQGAVDALVTTPESLALMLADPEAQARLAGLRWVVVDEWHELLGGKRGVLLELGLARLRARAPGLVLWGLSATLGNLAQARDVLLPHASADDAPLLHAGAPRPTAIETLPLPAGGRYAWSGHLGLALLAPVLERVFQARTSLLFTHTRGQAELWHRALAAVWPEDTGTLALHHGSLDGGLRTAVEDGLRAGRLRCVVATSSLELGVDLPAVEQVLQLGGPKALGRLLQRAGRAEHRPGGAGRVLGVPTHALELLEYAAAREALARGAIEPRAPLAGCLDVLAQHVVTLALGGGVAPDALLAEVRGTHAYRDLADADWARVLAFVMHGGEALRHYPEFQRVVLDEAGLLRLPDRRQALRHRLSVGTIVADGQVSVRLARGGALGSVDEAFIGRLAPGDRFHFAGRTLQLIRLEAMVAWTRLAKAGAPSASVPRYAGGRLALDGGLAAGVLDLLARADDALVGGEGDGHGDGHVDAHRVRDAAGPGAPARRLAALGPEAAALAPLLALQRGLSALPRPGRLLVEHHATRDGRLLCLFPFAGRTLHEGLAALLALRWSRLAPNTLTFAANEHGLLVCAAAAGTPAPDEATLRALLSPTGLEDDLRASLNLAELGRRQFREIARVAGLLPPSLPGRAPRSLRAVQASAALLYDVLRQHDPGHVLLEQAEREVLARQLALPGLRALLARLAGEPVVARAPASLTPLAFGLWADRLRETLSSEDWQARIARAAATLEKRHARR